MSEMQPGEMSQGEMNQIEGSNPIDAAIDRGVTRVLDEVVDRALAQLSDDNERNLVRSSLSTVVRELLSEVAEKEVRQQMSLAPTQAVAAAAMGEGVNTGINAAKQVKELGFVEFTAGLINGTFDAIIGATIKQMDAYAKLVADLAKSLSQFQAENVSEAQITAHLADRYPDGKGGTVIVPTSANTAAVPDTPADADRGIPAKSGKQKFLEIVDALILETKNLKEPLTRADFGIDNSVDADNVNNADSKVENKFTPQQVGKIRTKIGQSLATNMMEHLRAMAREGMARIVITNGEIFTRLTFNVTATDEQQIQQQKFHQDSFGVGLRASGGWGPVRASLGVNYSNLNVSAVNESSFNTVTMSAEMIGQVKLTFKTESFPPAVTQANS